MLLAFTTNNNFRKFKYNLVLVHTNFPRKSSIAKILFWNQYLQFAKSRLSPSKKYSQVFRICLFHFFIVLESQTIFIILSASISGKSPLPTQLVFVNDMNVNWHYNQCQFWENPFWWYFQCCPDTACLPLYRWWLRFAKSGLPLLVNTFKFFPSSIFLLINFSLYLHQLTLHPILS